MLLLSILPLLPHAGEDLMPAWRLENAPLHTGIEFFGAAVSLLTATLLLVNPMPGAVASGRTILFSAGLMLLAVVTAFHSLMRVEAGLNNWLCLGRLSSAVLLVGAAVPLVAGRMQGRRWLPPLVAALTLALSLLVVCGWGSALDRWATGKMSLSVVSSTLLLAAFGGHFLGYLRTRLAEDYVFAGLCLLLGASGLTYQQMENWSDRWWYWHFLRLAGYLLALGYVAYNGARIVRGFRQAICDKNRSALELQEHYQFLQGLVDAIPNPVFFKDMEGRYRLCNRAFEDALCRPREQVIGRTAFDVAPAEYAQKYHEMDRQLLLRGGSQTYESFLADGHGQDHHVVFNKAVYSDREGKPRGIVGVMSDVTEHRRVQAELEQARQAAEESARAKGAFLANMSHEMRTPLTSILGYAEMGLEQADLGGEVRQALTVIHRNGQRLLGLINQVLDLTRMEPGRMERRCGPCDCRLLISDVAGSLRAQASAKGLWLVTEFEGTIPACLHTDELRLREILSNLMGNAVKFTDRGGVRVVTRFRRQGRLGPTLEVEVQDTGIGIGPEWIGRLSEPFLQADGSAARRHGGMGLGLTIVRRLLDLLGGQMQVDSQVGRGSRFRVTLPVEAPPVDSTGPVDAAAPAATPSRLDGLHLLLAEDGPDNQHLISTLLRKRGARVDVAGNGLEALYRASRQRYDAILMDIQMPEMDGYEATRTLRRDGYEGPIIALTAHALAGERERCLEAGCSGFMTKPVDIRRLVAELASRGPQESAGACSRAPSPVATTDRPA